MVVSFLTPTYNRGYILKQLYQSLCYQSQHDFEWIVIDDGSTDDTQELVQKWKSEADFPILYRWKENGGKHRALNVGIKLANAPYICIVDSDDYLVDDAINKILIWTKEIDGDGRFAGVAGTRYTSNRELIGQFPANREYVDAKDISRRKNKLEGDKSEVYRTEILKQYPFPEFEGEKFLSECAVWNKIGMDGYLLRWHSEPLIICEYRADGLTKTDDKEARNYLGYTYVIRQQLLYEERLKRLALIAQYNYISRKKGHTVKAVSHSLRISMLELRLAMVMKWIHIQIKKV